MRPALEDQLYKACLLLFGPDIEISRDFLHYIQPSGIKSAYRKMALLTHPDRLSSSGENERRRSTDRFIETNRAYELLNNFIQSRDRRMRSRARNVKRGFCNDFGNGSRRQGNFYSGRVPERGLPLGQFLFYSGKISWEALIKAIIWQRKQRPKVGEIAKGWGLLSDEQIMSLITNRKPGEPLGEAAVRLRLLKPHQVNTLLFYQKRLQRPFGEYFLINKILNGNELDASLRSYMTHNARYRRHARAGYRKPFNNSWHFRSP